MLTKIYALYWVLIGGLLFTALPSYGSEPDKGEALSVAFPQENKTYHYQDPARLSQVLNDIYSSLDYAPYTSGVSLIRLSKNIQIEQQKDAIIQRLIKLNTDSALYLIAQISNTEFAFREALSFDLDTTRLFLKQNPLLAGRFQLVVPIRSNRFWVYGAIDEDTPLAISLHDGLSLRDYLATIESSNSEGKYRPWVIQPDQTLYQTKDIYWKGTPYFLSPGAVVFIGLQNLPEEFKDLNQQIAHLLTYRVEK